jgi:hypothetical protein
LKASVTDGQSPDLRRLLDMSYPPPPTGEEVTEMLTALGPLLRSEEKPDE